MRSAECGLWTVEAYCGRGFLRAAAETESTLRQGQGGEGP